MTDTEKKKLYEHIMSQIAPIVKKHIIYISTSEICMFVKENNRLEELYDYILSRANELLSELSNDEIKHMCVDYQSKYQMSRQIFGNYSNKKLFGKLIETFANDDEFKLSFSELKRSLVNVFGMQPHTVEIFNPFGHGNLAFIKNVIDDNIPDDYIISTIVPIINQNLPFIINFMDKNGYYLTRCALCEDVKNYKDSGDYKLMANMCFAPKKPADISSLVKNSPYIYHVTPESKIKEISETGLIPKERKSDYSIMNEDVHYPKRIYFYYGMNQDEAIEYAKEDMNYGKYYLLRIKTSALPNTLPIYYDQLISGNAIYLEYSIPPEHIEIVESFFV